MTGKPRWARKRERLLRREERPLWALTPDEWRVLLVTFAGGLGSIIVGAAMLGGAVALARSVSSDPVSLLGIGLLTFMAIVGIGTVILIKRWIPPGRLVTWVYLPLCVLALAICMLVWIGIAAGIH